MKPAEPARIHLLPAKESPYVVVIRRKPSKCFHIIRWNTKTDELEHGSWFSGKLYPKRCDISFDGNWMVYLAMGDGGNTWNGICRLPFLKTVAQGPNMGTWFGGGYWRDRKTLLLNRWKPDTGTTPFRIRELKSENGGEDMGVCVPKLERDGWTRRGDNYGTHRRIKSASTYTIECTGDDGWESRPTLKHPPLIAKYVGYLRHGYTFRYSIKKYPKILDDTVDSACWNSAGDLICSRLGVLYKYSLEDLDSGRPGSVHDIEHLTKAKSEE